MSSLPKTYKAVVLKKPGDPFEITEVELKHPSAGEVLVKVKACGICFSDVALARGEFGPGPFPRVPGHEVVGDVVELGSGVESFSIGDRVGAPWHGGHDGSCRQCARSQYQMCDNQAINGVSRDGGYAEYVLLRAEAVVRVPADMDPAQAAPLLCAGVTVFNGMRKLHIEQGNLVAVQGLGGLGHLGVQFARRMGYEVAALSTGDDKEEFARKLGAHHYINVTKTDAGEELMKLGGAAAIVQTAPSPKVFGALVNGLAAGGKILSVAAAGVVELDTVTLLSKGGSVQGWPCGHALDSEETIRFAVNQGVECMIEKYPFADVQKAVDSLVAGKPRFRNVLIME